MPSQSASQWSIVFDSSGLVSVVNTYNNTALHNWITNALGLACHVEPAKFFSSLVRVSTETARFILYTCVPHTCVYFDCNWS